MTSAKNYQDALFRLQIGATGEDKTVEEAQEDIRQATRSSVKETSWYQTIVDHVDRIGDKLQTYQDATQLIKDLKLERKSASSKEEKKTINQQIKDAQKVQKANKLSGWDKKQLQNSEKIINLIDNNTEAFKLFEKLGVKLDKLLTKTNGIFNKSQQKQYDKIMDQLDSASDAVRRVSEISGDAAVMGTSTYQNLLAKITNILSKSSLSNSNKEKLDMYAGEAEWLAKYATMNNVTSAQTIYEQLYKLQTKLDKKGKLNAKDTANKNYLEELQNDLIKERTKYDASLQRQLEISMSLADPSLANIRAGINAYKKELEELENMHGAEREAYIKASKPYSNWIKKDQNKVIHKASGMTNADVVNALLEYGSIGMTEQELNQIAKDYQTIRKTTDYTKNAYKEAKARLDALALQRQTEDKEQFIEKQDQIRKALVEYEQLLAESEEKANEALQKAWEIAKTIVEYNVNDLLSQIDFVDAVIDRWQQLANLYEQFDPDVLRDKFKMDIDNTKSSLELMREGYTTAIGDYDTETGLMGKIKKEREVIKAYEELVNMASTAVSSDGKTDWSKIFADFKETDVYKESADMQETISTLENLLASNDYDGSTWVSDWNKAMAEAEQEILSTIENVKELTDALRENVTFKAVYDAIEALDLLEGRFSSLSNIILDDWVRDANGVTDFGYAKAQLLYKELQASQQKTAKYAEHIKEIMDNRDLYTVEKEYTEALNQAQQDYADSIANTESIMSNIYELSKNLEEAEIERFENLIEAQKKALQKKKEYWDYSKNVRNAQNEIEAIEAQINALNGVKICPYLFNCWNALKLYDYNITMKYA